MSRIDELKVKIFADGADVPAIARLRHDPLIKGFTTNPTLMRKAGVADYEACSREILALVPDRPVSLEVLADDFAEMERQARAIAAWGTNAFVKIPVTNTRGEFAGDLLRRLTGDGIPVNVTALMTAGQVERVVASLEGDCPATVSVFAGRVADAGTDPVPVMAEAVRLVSERPNTELIWASPREIFNVLQADAVGCHIITVTHDLLAKLPLIGKSLDVFSLETVEMFYRDALAAGYTIRSTGAD